MIKQAAGNITYSYSNDLEPTIESELIQFSSLIRSSAELQTSSEKAKSIELKMYELFHTQNNTQTFPNIEIALRIYVFISDGIKLQWWEVFLETETYKDELINRIGDNLIFHR